MKTANTLPPSRPAMRGFTLLELMTALTVLAILMGVGVPAFNSMIRSNQIAAESGNLVSALNSARSEALKRGMRVSVCALAADLKSCIAEDDPPDWSRGWIVFADDLNMGVLEESDEVLQNWPAPADGVALSTAATSVTFTRQARSEFPETFQISKKGCSKDQRRDVSVDMSGRVSVARGDCT